VPGKFRLTLPGGDFFTAEAQRELQMDESLLMTWEISV
jgi:hypothetical protein